MAKAKLIVFTILFSITLTLFTGCQSSGADATQGTNPSTEPSSEATAPTSVESMLTMERIITHMTEDLTYAKAKEILGMSDK